MANSGRLDSLRDSFKDAQSAKADLESVLKETRRIRRDVEKTAEREANRLKELTMHLAEKSECLKVAQHKRSQSQALSNSLRASVEEKKRLLADIVSSVEQEDKLAEKDVSDFEDLLTQLASVMLEAKSFYVPDKLQTAIQEKDLDCQKLQETYDALENELSMLSSYAESMGIPQDVDGIDKQAVWQILEEDLQRTLYLREGRLTELHCQS